MTYQESYDKLMKHAAEVEKWKQGMVKSHPSNGKWKEHARPLR